jgi:hypothetical protein
VSIAQDRELRPPPFTVTSTGRLVGAPEALPCVRNLACDGPLASFATALSSGG